MTRDSGCLTKQGERYVAMAALAGVTFSKRLGLWQPELPDCWALTWRSSLDRAGAAACQELGIVPNTEIDAFMGATVDHTMDDFVPLDDLLKAEAS